MTHEATVHEAQTKILRELLFQKDANFVELCKVSNLENDFKVYDTKNNKITGDFNNTGVSLSAEYGRKNVLHNGWYIEPQAQFTLGYLGGDSYTTSNGIEVSQSGIKSAVGRIGFNIGKEVGSKGVVYAKANLLHEFGGGYDVTMYDGRDGVKVGDTFNDTWFEYGVGAAFAAGKNPAGLRQIPAPWR